MKLKVYLDTPTIKEEVAQESDISLLINSNLDSIELTEYYGGVESCMFDLDIEMKKYIGGGLESASDQSFLSKVWDKIKAFFERIRDYFRRGLKFVSDKFKRKTKNLEKATEELKEDVHNVVNDNEFANYMANGNTDKVKASKRVKPTKDEEIEELRKKGILRIKFRKMTDELLDDYGRFITAMSDENVQMNKRERSTLFHKIRKSIENKEFATSDEEAYKYNLAVFSYYTAMLGVWEGVCAADILEDNGKYVDIIKRAQETDPIKELETYKGILNEIFKGLEKPYVRMGKHKSLDYFTLDININKADSEIEKFIRNRVSDNGKFMQATEYLNALIGITDDYKQASKSMNTLPFGKTAISNEYTKDIKYKNDGTFTGDKKGFENIVMMARLSTNASLALSKGYIHILSHINSVIGSIEKSIKDAIVEVYEAKNPKEEDDM